MLVSVCSEAVALSASFALLQMYFWPPACERDFPVVNSPFHTTLSVLTSTNP